MRGWIAVGREYFRYDAILEIGVGTKEEKVGGPVFAVLILTTARGGRVIHPDNKDPLPYKDHDEALAAAVAAALKLIEEEINPYLFGPPPPDTRTAADMGVGAVKPAGAAGTGPTRGHA